MGKKIVRAVVAGVLGVVTTLGVAVACVWWQSQRATYLWQDEVTWEGSRFMILRNASFGIDRFGWWAISQDAATAVHDRWEPAGVGTNLPPSWSRIHDSLERARHVLPPGLHVGTGRMEIRAGWPLRVLGGSQKSDDFTREWKYVQGGSVQLPPRWKGTNWEVGRVMPVMPLWEGIAGSVALYGAAWWAGLLALCAAQRLLRRRRQRCVGCGYDRRGIGEAACPECGCVPRVRASGAPIAAGGVR